MGFSKILVAYTTNAGTTADVAQIIGEELGETRIEGIQVWIDPALAKPPKNAHRLSFKERYATVTNYLRPALRTARSVRPVSVGFFGGRLELFRLKW